MSNTTQSSFTCRKAAPDDLAFIYDSLSASAYDAGLAKQFEHTATTLEKALFSEDAYAECIVAQVNDQPIGLMLFSIMHNNFPVFLSPGLFVHDLFVLKEYRLHGIARKLGSYLVNIAQEKKCTRIEGMVPSNGNVDFFFKTFRGLKKVDHMDYLRLMLNPESPAE